MLGNVLGGTCWKLCNFIGGELTRFSRLSVLNCKPTSISDEYFQHIVNHLALDVILFLLRLRGLLEALDIGKLNKITCPTNYSFFFT